jgi:tetratricopeptide (TPR) repeat protein
MMFVPLFAVLEAQPSAAGRRESGVASVAVADSLMQAGELEASYTVLSTRLAREANDHEARWRATRGALGLGIVGGTHAIRMHWLRVADAQGRELLRLGPNTADAMAWAAAARGRRAQGEDGIRTVARLARETWALTGRALALQPDHAIANEVRGKLHAEVARMPVVARFFARWLVGDDLVAQAARWELAELHLRRSIAADPGLVVAYLDLGETYRLRRKWADAVVAYRRGLAVVSRYPVDEHFKSIMRERLDMLQRTPASP